MRALGRPALPALGVGGAVAGALALRLLVAGEGRAATSLPAAAVFAAALLCVAAAARVRERRSTTTMQVDAHSIDALRRGNASQTDWGALTTQADQRRGSGSQPASARRLDWRAVAAGTCAGLALVLLAALLPGLPLHVWARPEGAAIVLWTALVAAVGGAEELVFRGVLFDAIARSTGPITAACVCAVAFALIHVPLYGWQALPLDIGVGLCLGGLRMLTGGVAAPAAAHIVADIGAWTVV